MKEQALKFMKGHDFCVVSCVNAAGKPESAFVGFTCNDRLELVIGTSNLSRKYKNILRNPSVSVVVADTEGEVQYEGEAHISDKADESFMLPGSKKYREDPTQVWIKVTPKWMRLIIHGDEDKITEMSEFA